MSTPTATDPTYFHDSYFIRGKDHQGNERYYRMRLFEVHENADGTKTRKQVSLTLNEWERQANLVQRYTSDFFAKPIALPDSFKIDMQGTWRLTAAGRPDLDQDLLYGVPLDQIGKINTAFLGMLEHKQLTATLLPIPPLPPEMAEDNALNPAAIHTAAPVGIHNVTKYDCFISAFLQAFVFTNPELMQSLWEERRAGTSAEIGRFLHRYQQVQQRPPGPNGEKAATDGVDQLRPAITRSNETTMDFLTGAHDSIEAFDFIADLLAEPIEQEGLPMKGYIQVVPQDKWPLEFCIIHSCTQNKAKKDPPKHMMVVNNTKDAFADVYGTTLTHSLTSFIQHTAAGGGHYTAYVKKPDDTYYKCNDSSVTTIDRAEFLKEAKTARAALYTRD